MSHIKTIGKDMQLITGVNPGNIYQQELERSLLAHSMGLSWLSSVYLGIALTFSSTIVIVKLLTDKRDTETVYGRHVFGLMIVQDLVAIMLMLVLALSKCTRRVF
jgi:predicted Kef-type K+ transport protein